MAVYLDTNAMYNWRTFAEQSRLALAVVARELEQEIVVPSLVAEELEGHMRRKLASTAHAFDQAADAVRGLFDLDYVETEPMIDVSSTLHSWRQRLDETFGSCEVTADDALNGLRREIAGTPPAQRDNPNRPGRGARDAAIWLAGSVTTCSVTSPGSSSPRMEASGSVTVPTAEL
jgi:hypothetical protein